MNFFDRILHYYIYDMRLKKKLVVSHTILFLLPTAVLICFLFLNIFRIVIDDALRSEQALSSQSVLSVENLVSHVTHASDTLNSSYVIRDTFDISNAQAQSLIPSRNKINNLLRLADTLTDHSLIESVTFYYDDHTYHKLDQFNTDTQKLFLPLSQVSSPWLKHFETTGASQLFVPKVGLSEKEVTEHGPLAYIKPIFYRSYDGDPESIAAYSAIYFSEDAFEEILKKDSTIKDEFSFLINDDLNLISASDPSLFSNNLAIQALQSDPSASGQFQLVNYREFSAYTACFP